MIDGFTPALLAGKTAFLAGASSGINLAIAQRLAEQGARVALLSRSVDKIEAAAQAIVAAGGDAIGLAADVRDPEAVDRALAMAVDRFGPIDILLSGAAGNFVSPAAGISPNGFKTVIDIDLIGTFNVIRLAYPHLRRPGASVVSITAPQATMPYMMQAHVCAAKAGINMLTKVLALEWGGEGIRVNAVSPGPIAGTEGMARLASSPRIEAATRAGLALGRFGEKREIADAVLFLCTDNAAYITGTILECDGGTALGPVRGAVG